MTINGNRKIISTFNLRISYVNEIIKFTNWTGIKTVTVSFQNQNKNSLLVKRQYHTRVWCGIGIVM